MASKTSIKNQNIAALNQARAFLVTNNLQMPTFEAVLGIYRKHVSSSDRITFKVFPASLEAGWRWENNNYSDYDASGEPCTIQVTQYVGSPGHEEQFRSCGMSRGCEDFPFASGMAVVTVTEICVLSTVAKSERRFSSRRLIIEAHLAPRL